MACGSHFGYQSDCPSGCRSDFDPGEDIGMDQWDCRIGLAPSQGYHIVPQGWLMEVAVQLSIDFAVDVEGPA